MAAKPTLIIFAKSPRMGVSKTRLAAGIGAVGAWRVKRALDAYTCRVALRAQKWQTLLAVAPAKDEAALFPGVWPSRVGRISQGKGDLGERMARAIRHYGRGPVCIIGSDLPDLTVADLHAAFAALRRHDVVIGPARDGGFWLIGLAPRHARRLRLDNIRWSHPQTLKDTLASFPAHWRIARLRELEDVDDAASLERFLPLADQNKGGDKRSISRWSRNFDPRGSKRALKRYRDGEAVVEV
jgi:uncharacterized protein